MRTREREFTNVGVLDRPLIWGVLYLGLIPLFAVLYTTQAGSFYQTTATSEPAFSASEAYVGQAVADAVDAVVDEQAVTDFGESSPKRHRSSSDGMRITETQVLVSVSIESNTGSDEVSQDVELDLGLPSVPEGVNMPGRVFFYYKLNEVSGRAQGSRNPDNTLRLLEEASAGPALPHIYLSTSATDRLDQTIAAAKGLVGGLPQQLIRMIYLSAVTVTTLGYGDITPVTSAARLLVVVEAIAGVILIGLFLNALSRRQGRRRNYGSSAETAESSH